MGQYANPNARAARLGNLAFVTALCTLFIVMIAGCNDAPMPIGSVTYNDKEFPPLCSPGEKRGGPGATDTLTSARSLRFNVRAPLNYDSTRAHPMLVIYAPAGFDAIGSERYANLTREATSRGFVLAFPEHRRLAMTSFDALGEIPDIVLKQWCIDPHRIYFAGHSDGGATSAAVTFLKKSASSPRAIVVSGAGIREQDLAQYPCPAPLSVTIMHSREDELFPLPRYGKDASRWWARCNRCSDHTVPTGVDSCVEYTGCAVNTATRYCEYTGPHRKWPAARALVLELLVTSPSPQVQRP